MPGPVGVITVKGLQSSTAQGGKTTVICREVQNVQAEDGERARIVLKPSPHGKVIKVQEDEAEPTVVVSLGGDLSEEKASNILAVLKKNINIFAWRRNVVGGVSPDLIMRYLAVKTDTKPKKQKLRKMSIDRQEVAKAEVQKLLKVGVIPEIDHPEWLANPVFVKKSNGKWRMYHQILINPGDKPKTAFITPFDTFCHIVGIS
uniref:Retrotransposon protein, putative, Ty3-gypsy subclass n=1 Tax=Oryza sativa subsp. japonica TaxID=39947 RepID=Q2QTF7_ORYSJ|nr:retrotransposon protein, putative, Ty3-gypsy subclass [Oryza sativa Japonica Group]